MALGLAREAEAAQERTKLSRDHNVTSADPACWSLVAYATDTEAADRMTEWLSEAPGWPRTCGPGRGCCRLAS